MTHEDYFRILEIPRTASLEDIKKAYRKKAYLYHPDRNHSPDAKDRFIAATEAYEFLIANYNHLQTDEEEFRQAMEDWRKYRQDRSRRRANTYARASYDKFRKTNFYRTTRIFDGTRAVYGLIMSALVIGYSVYGYIYRLKHPWNDEKPSFIVFLILLSIGVLFLLFSIGYTKAWLSKSKKYRKQN